MEGWKYEAEIDYIFRDKINGKEREGSQTWQYVELRKEESVRREE